MLSIAMKRTSTDKLCLRSFAGLAFAAAMLCLASYGETPAATSFHPVTCEGVYPLHLQGIATDGTAAIFWSWTDTLVKTDLQGHLLARVPAPNHHGDPCYAGGKVYVAVNLGKFNAPEGKADSWVYVYHADTLALEAKHAVPEVVHGAGGIAEHAGKFLVIGGLPPGVEENYLYEYDAAFKFRGRHVLASGYTDKGIQTATWRGDSWWFGCYGKPQVLLRANAEFKLMGRWNFDAALGLEALPDGRFLLGRDSAKGKEHTGRVVIGHEDAARGMTVIVEANELPAAAK